MRSAGLVLAAGGLAAANDVIFAPAASTANVGGGVVGQAGDIAANFNWRIIPATLILALLLGGLETVVPDFAVGLGGLVLLSVLVIPYGNAPTPIDNISRVVGTHK